MPIHYNYIVQGFLYNHISKRLGKFLHDSGFLFEKRSFKMFTFSRLQGKYWIGNGRIEFTPPVYLTISSPFEKFIEELANTLLRGESLELDGREIHVESIKVHPEPKIGGEVKIKTLSPIVVYSTLLTEEGKKKTYYYNPYEGEFADLIDKNLRKKSEAFYGKRPRARKLKIEMIRKPEEKILKYRGNIIKGYLGRFILNGNKRLLRLGYDAGIGSKNSQGFGMFEVLDD